MLSQRSQFILELGAGISSHSELCRRYGISRTAGYKWRERFKEQGLLGLQDRSRKPLTTTSSVPHEITVKIVAYRQAHPSWGALKIRKILLKECQQVPSRRTIHRILQDCNLISTRRRHYRRKAHARVVIKAGYCNHVWTVDFKGWWRTKDGRKVYPLTIRDEYSKMVLAVDILSRPSLELVKEAFIKCFKRYGLPEYIRSDNGTPFSYAQGFCGLSRLSAWWMKLGVVPNFIPPASPQYNPGHERMHRDMAQDLQATPARNNVQQQVIADGWRDDYNTLRPHDALQDKTPSQVYKPSHAKYRSTEAPFEYPERMLTRYVNKQGIFRYGGKRFFFTKAVGGENVGLEFTADGALDLWFANVRIAHSDASLSSGFKEYNLITDTVSVTKGAA